ncbi:SDR family NAD(P)-dependent oxidoreductase, partial [bacterium]|nr:SDR family NAD(P)-dependent oxidoreductase [bacterium]
LITGSARRLGREIALALAANGADIVIHHTHSPALADEAAAAIRGMGRNAWIVASDLSDPRNADQLVNRAWERTPLDGIINNAAVFHKQEWFDTSIELWQDTLAINLTAPFLISKAFAKSLSGMNTGKIVNMLDWRALRPGDDHLAYTVSKAALGSLTKALAQAVAPRISVNALALGAVRPPLDQPLDPEIVKKIPLQ